MEQAGYDVWWQVINAKDFGVPQNRERIFAIGIRKGSGREILFEQRESEQDIKKVGDLDSETWRKRNESIRRVYSPEGVAPTTPTAQGGGVMTKIAEINGSQSGAIYDSIRRLTPTECERLMGLEDNWTTKDIMDGEEVEISDTQRYKMCGNGVVVQCVDYIFNLLVD
jgi:DNA (cytosine-5)-methyltransferase 1